MVFCFGSKKKKKYPEEKNNQPRAGPAHIGGPGLGVWPVQPLPPDSSYQGDCGQNHVREKRFNDLEKKSPPSPSPKCNSDSDDGKGRSPKKDSACDQKFTPEATVKVNQSPKSNSDSSSPVTRKTNEFRQPLPHTPEKYKMSSTDSVEKQASEFIRRGTEYDSVSSAYEEQHIRPRKISSDENKDRKSAETNCAVYSNQQKLNSLSETWR